MFPQNTKHTVWVPTRLVQTVDSSIQRPEDKARSRNPTDTVAEAAAELTDS